MTTKVIEEFAAKVLSHKKAEYDALGMRIRSDTGYQINPFDLTDVARACKEWADAHGRKFGISIVLKYSSTSGLWNTRVWRGDKECQWGVDKNPAMAMIFGVLNFIAWEEKHSEMRKSA